jgi:hypothetical protein
MCKCNKAKCCKNVVENGKVIWENLTPELYEELCPEDKDIVDTAQATESIAHDRAVDIFKMAHYGQKKSPIESNKLAAIVYNHLGGSELHKLVNLSTDPEEVQLAMELLDKYYEGLELAQQ